MPTSHRRIDHLVIAVRDLEAAADLYSRLGFQVGNRNRHPWGTENRLVQFGTAFLELITIGDTAAIPPHEPGRFSFGAFVRDFLERREGCAMLVLDSNDAAADAAGFARLGIGRFEPFYFERQGMRPDGSETRVAFTLAFASDPALPTAGFFVCQQHFPENFWNAEFQRHPNGATGVRDVTLRTPDPARHATFLAGFTGTASSVAGQGALTYALQQDGRLKVVRGEGVAGFGAFAVAVPDLAAAAACLERNGVSFRREAGRIGVDAADVFGVNIGFVAGGPAGSAPF